MPAVRLAQHGQVEVVVDDEKGARTPGEAAQAASQLEQVPARKELVAKLEDLRAAP
jgi:hypothetical protein